MRDNQTTVNISFSQAFSANWAQGDENLFLLKIMLNSKNKLDIGPLRFKSTASLSLSANYRDDSVDVNPLRVGENDMFFEGVFVYPIQWILDPYFAGSLRSAVTESFSYTQQKKPVRNANLWDPVTSQQGAGFTYALRGESGAFNTRIGFSLQQSRAEHHTQLTDDFKTLKEKERYKALSGIEFVNEAQLYGDTTVAYTGRLTMFGSFQDLDVWTVRWDNDIRFRLWKSFSLTWSFNVLHDIRYTRRTQFKQSILFGINQEF